MDGRRNEAANAGRGARVSGSLVIPLLFALLLAPAGTLAAAKPDAAAEPDTAAIARGEYLVTLLGCGRCHTEGYLVGNQPTGPAFAGSTVGIAYTAFDTADIQPGLVFAGNLTSDPETGLGNWSIQEIVRVLSTGIGTDGHQRLPVMPWANYGSALTREDRFAVAHYLKSLPAVKRPIPDSVPAGGRPVHPYVRFGVYQFHPFADAEDDAGR